MAQHLGLRELFETHVDLGDAPGRANVGHKAMTVIHSVLAGGDCIDDCDVLRAGAHPGRVGPWGGGPLDDRHLLEKFHLGPRPPDRPGGRRGFGPGLGGGRRPRAAIRSPSTWTLSIVETYGLAKQGGTRFTYNHVRGYHPLFAVMAGTADVLRCRLRGGNAHSGRGRPAF